MGRAVCAAALGCLSCASDGVCRFVWSGVGGGGSWKGDLARPDGHLSKIMARGHLVLLLLSLCAAVCDGLSHGIVTMRRVRQPMMMADTGEKQHDGEKQHEARKQQAKARRVISQEGKGGVRPTRGLNGYAAKAKKTEQKKVSKGQGFGKPKDKLLYDRKPPADAPCACGSGKPFDPCCAPLLDGIRLSATPEELVRSRYCAYRYRVPDYLISTTDPEGDEWDADQSKWKRSLLTFCDDFEFQGLEVLADGIEMGTGSAKVPFKAKFCQKGTVALTILNELSTFRQTGNGEWLYTKGEVSYEAQ